MEAIFFEKAMLFQLSDWLNSSRMNAARDKTIKYSQTVQLVQINS